MNVTKFESLALGTRGVPIPVRGPSETRQEPIPPDLTVLRSFGFSITLNDLEHTVITLDVRVSTEEGVK